jgi:hypothetical protein
MAPNITDAQSWQQANLLLQPIFIRLIDHFRKILEDSAWVGEYQTRELWPESVEESVKLRRTTLLQTLENPETIAPEAVESLQAELASLPAPYPGYELLIFLKDQPESKPLARFDLWELSYQICFCNYLNPDLNPERFNPARLNTETINSVNPNTDSPPAIVDQTLLDPEGEVEWNAVDAKTAKVVATLFEHLPHSWESRTNVLD